MAIPNVLHTAGFLRSASIRRTDLPLFASERAIFDEQVVLPSLSVELVIAKTEKPFLSFAFSSFVLISLKVSIKGKPTFLSVIRSLERSPFLFLLLKH
jgi:hypothetical protein